MISVDEDALICDFAETYGIYDYRSLPVRLAATLSYGLRDNSRIKLKLSGSNVPFETLLLAGAYDRLSFLSWCKTEDAKTGMNRPVSVVNKLTGKQDASDVESFDSAGDFMKARQNIMKGD